MKVRTEYFIGKIFHEVELCLHFTDNREPWHFLLEKGMFPDIFGQSWIIIILFQGCLSRVGEENSCMNTIWEFPSMKCAYKKKTKLWLLNTSFIKQIIQVTVWSF